MQGTVREEGEVKREVGVGGVEGMRGIKNRGKRR